MKTAHWHALLLAGAGVMHFKAPQVYDAIVPRSLPGNARTYTLVSGAAELAIAAGLALPLTRRLAGLAASALYVAVSPRISRWPWIIARKASLRAHRRLRMLDCRFRFL